MNTKLTIVGVALAMLPYVCAQAGESQASSMATTQNTSSAGNEQSSQATNKPTTSATTSSSTTSTTQTGSHATTQNPHARGRVINPRIPEMRRAAYAPPARRKAVSTVRYYKPGYKKSGHATKTSSKKVRWQTRNWN